jgi:hypothetical protein
VLIILTDPIKGLDRIFEEKKGIPRIHVPKVYPPVALLEEKM